MPGRTRCAVPMLTALLVAAGCGDAESPEPVAPALSVNARSADRCANVDVAVNGTLGLWVFNGVPVPGAAPEAITLAGIDGTIASVLTPDVTSHGGSETVHWVLQHVFVAGQPSSVDLGGGFIVPSIDLADHVSWFTTQDRAVCAAAGGGPLRCRVNDRMNVADGAGVFAGAGGYLHNHGWITITDPQTGAGVGDFHLRGRVCGAGVNG